MQVQSMGECALATYSVSGNCGHNSQKTPSTVILIIFPLLWLAFKTSQISNVTAVEINYCCFLHHNLQRL